MVNEPSEPLNIDADPVNANWLHRESRCDTEILPSKIRTIRANLGAGWAFATQIEDELREDRYRADMSPSETV
jgi:hypothetical protein